MVEKSLVRASSSATPEEIAPGAESPVSLTADGDKLDLYAEFDAALRRAGRNRTRALRRLHSAVVSDAAAPSAAIALTSFLQAAHHARQELRQTLRQTPSATVDETAASPAAQSGRPTVRQLEALRDRGLFDEAYYRDQAGLSPTADAWEHFITRGAADGIEAHPLLDPGAAYRSGRLDGSISATQLAARFPTRADEVSHPLFDPEFYVSYNRINLKRGQSALGHYVREGRRNGLSPHPLIDLEWIGKSWPLASEEDFKFDLVAYLQNPELKLLSTTALFDAPWYMQAAGEPVAHPLAHYVSDGFSRGLSPNRFFDEAWYRNGIPDIAPHESGLAHYLKGAHPTVAPHPAFDRTFYLQLYGDVAQAGVDPYTHYVTCGASEGRLPGALVHRLMLQSRGATSPQRLAHWLTGEGNPFDILATDALTQLWRRERIGLRNRLLYSLAKPARVVRKRLRNRGWLKAPLKGKADFVAMRAAAPRELRPFLTPVAPYDAWRLNNRFTTKARAELQARLDAAEGLPRISIVTPVYNTPSRYLQEMAASVLEQVYQNWELCFVDDASTARDIPALLSELAAKDSRIRVHRRASNGGISEASNDGVRMSTGDVIALVDHDDKLTPDALGEMALYYGAHPQADIVYSDDDKFDDEGRHFAPQFKPDWSPTLLLSYMYISHLLTFRRELFFEAGGFRKNFDGSQDYDFALRATEHARHVGHIPRILYHWRAAPGSTATSGDAKPASFVAGATAVREALARRGVDAETSHPDWALATKVGMYAIAFPDDGPSVTIIVPTFNQVEYLRDCISSLAATTYRNFDVLVIDNGSTDSATIEYLKEVRRLPRHAVKRIPQRKSGFSFAALMNQAVELAHGEYVLFLNNDTRVISPRWLSQMVGYGQLDGVGSVGAKLYFGDDTVQHAGILIGQNDGLAGHAFRNAARHDWGYMGFAKTTREYSAVTAACALTSRELFTRFGGFDETHFAVAYNDADYGCRLADAGLTNVYCADAELYHFEGKTRPKRDNPLEVTAMRRKYRNWRDRWYNPSLSRDHEACQISTRRSSHSDRNGVRVAVVSHSLNLEGAPNTLLDLVLGLKSRGVIEPMVFSPQEGPLRARYEAAGVEVHILNLPSAQAGHREYQASIDRLAKGFLAHGIEIVISNTLTMYQAVNAASVAGIAAIWCQHESEPWESYFDHVAPEQRPFAYAAFGQAYRVTYVAEATRRTWAGVQTRDNSELIRHAIPPERLQEEVTRWTRTSARKDLHDIKRGELLLLVAGTVCRRKGQLDAVRMLNHLPAEVCSRIRVVIAGAIGEADYLAALQQELDAAPQDISARVTITGPVDDMSRYFAAADMLLCTSRIESAPRVIVEAMAFGLPIITTPVFGIPELVDEDVNALFYAPDDTPTLAHQVARLVETSALRKKFAEASPHVLQSRPDFDDMLDRYEALIREATLVSTSDTSHRH